MTGTVNDPSSGPHVENLQLVNDTGVSNTDRITTDATVTGTIQGDFISNHVDIEFDHHSDGWVNGTVSTLYLGSSFQYDPRSLDSSLDMYVGPFTLRYRLVEYDTSYSVVWTGAWQDFEMTLESNQPPSIAVVDDDYQSIYAGSSSVHFGSTYQGTPSSKSFTISNWGMGPLSLDTSSLSVPNGFSVTQSFAPSVAPSGDTSFTIRLDATTSGSFGGTVSFDTNDPQASTFTFDVTATVNDLSSGPHVDNLQLLNDTGVSNTDRITTDPTVTGTIQGDFSAGHASVEFDHNGDGWANGSVGSLYPGSSFQYDPRSSDSMLEGYVGPFTLRYRALEYDSMGYLIWTGAWQEFEMTLESGLSPSMDVLDDNYQAVYPGISTVDFGSTVQGVAVSKTFAIHNWGSGSLLLDTASLSVPSGFTVTQTFAPTVEPNGNMTNFTIRLDAASSGSFAGTVSFNTNDPQANPFTFDVSGTVTPSSAAQIEVRGPDSQPISRATGVLSFGTTVLGSPIIKTLVIHNHGDADLEIDPFSLTIPAGFEQAGNYATVISPGDFTTLPIRLTTSEAGTHSGTLSFDNNDPANNPFYFTVSGTVTSGSTQPEIDNLRIANNTGVSHTDHISDDPTVTGEIVGDFQAGTVTVEFDHQGDAAVDGSVLVESSGETFVYDPRATDAALVDHSGRLNLRHRLVHRDAQNEVLSTGPWLSFHMIVDGGGRKGDGGLFYRRKAKQRGQDSL